MKHRRAQLVLDICLRGVSKHAQDAFTPSKHRLSDCHTSSFFDTLDGIAF